MKSLTQFIKEGKSANGKKVSFEEFLSWATGCMQDYDDIEYMKSTVWDLFGNNLDGIIDAGKKTKKFSNFKEFIKWCEKHKDDEVTLKEQPNAKEHDCYDYSFVIDEVDFEFPMCRNTYPNRQYF